MYGARIRDDAEWPPGLRKCTDYYSLLLFLGASDRAMSTPSIIKEDYWSLGVTVKASGMHVVFSSILLIKRNNFEGAHWIWRINKWLQDLCHRQGLGCLDHMTLRNLVYQGLMGSICQRRRGEFSVLSLPNWWWKLQTKINRGGESQSIPLLRVWCKGFARHDWWGITGQQENTWSAEQRNSSLSSQ